MPKSITSILQRRIQIGFGAVLIGSFIFTTTLGATQAQSIPATPPITPPTTSSPAPTPPITPPTGGDSEIVIKSHQFGSGQVGRYFFMRLTASEKGSSGPLTITTNGLPNGLDLGFCFTSPRRNKTVEYCRIHGLPQESGEFDVEVTAANGQYQTTTETITLRIKEGRRWFSWWR